MIVVLERKGDKLETINAAVAVIKYGQSLIGNVCETARYGDWRGGLTEIIEIAPDANAPDIVFRVRHFTEEFGEIGVLAHEEIGLFPDGAGSTLIEGKVNA